MNIIDFLNEQKNGQKASTICGRRIILIMKNISTGSITIQMSKRRMH